MNPGSTTSTFSLITDFFADIVPPETVPQSTHHGNPGLDSKQRPSDQCGVLSERFGRRLRFRTEPAVAGGFLLFYDTAYDHLDARASIPAELHAVFAQLATTDRKLVIASNPIFPLNVQRKRLAWTGLDHISFDLITHIENMSFCKPRREYYLQICEMIAAEPAACLMVGNDPINDMVAATAGLKTYLTQDGKDIVSLSLTAGDMHKNCRLTDIPPPDFHGPLAGVPAAVQKLTTS